MFAKFTSRDLKFRKFFDNDSVQPHVSVLPYRIYSRQKAFMHDSSRVSTPPTVKSHHSDVADQLAPVPSAAISKPRTGPGRLLHTNEPDPSDKLNDPIHVAEETPSCARGIQGVEDRIRQAFIPKRSLHVG